MPAADDHIAAIAQLNPRPRWRVDERPGPPPGSKINLRNNGDPICLDGNRWRAHLGWRARDDQPGAAFCREQDLTRAAPYLEQGRAAARPRDSPPDWQHRLLARPRPQARPSTQPNGPPNAAMNRTIFALEGKSAALTDLRANFGYCAERVDAGRHNKQ